MMNNPVYDDDKEGQDKLKKAVQNMANGDGLLFEKDGPNLKISKITVKDIFILSKTTDVYHVVSLMMRKGAAYFFNYLEYRFFPPETKLNDEYGYRVLKWNDLLWAICTVPLEKKHSVDEAAIEAKMQIQDGAVPFVLKEKNAIVSGSINNKSGMPGETDWFPLCCKNMGTLENNKESVIYSSGGEQDASIEETMKLKKLWEKGEQG